jgi:hypothetical protein
MGASRSCRASLASGTSGHRTLRPAPGNWKRLADRVLCAYGCLWSSCVSRDRPTSKRSFLSEIRVHGGSGSRRYGSTQLVYVPSWWTSTQGLACTNSTISLTAGFFEICQQLRPWECGNPEEISKECALGGKPTYSLSMLSILCHFHGPLWKRVSQNHNHRIDLLATVEPRAHLSGSRLFGYVLTATRGLGQSDWRGLSPIDPSPWCSTPSRFFQCLEVRIERLDDRPALLH